MSSESAVYTGWDRESILDGFRGENKLFFILTNSRGFTEEQTAAAHREIAAAVSEVSEETGIDYVIMNRTDSTLRGHFPLETAVLREDTLPILQRRRQIHNKQHTLRKVRG